MNVRRAAAKGGSFFVWIAYIHITETQNQAFIKRTT